MTPPEPPIARLPPSAFVLALRELEPRPAALLGHRLVARRSLEDCAGHYGVPEQALSVLLLRAALLLATRLGVASREPSGDDEEAAWARMLASALEREDAPVPVGLVPLVEVCRRLRAVGPDVATGMEAATKEDQASPQRQREDWMRKLAVAALLALTAYLYLSRPEEPPRRARPAPQQSTPDAGTQGP